MDSKSTYTLLLKVAMTPDLDTCTPNTFLPPGAQLAPRAFDSGCFNLDPSEVTPVNDQTYHLRGPTKPYATFPVMLDAAIAL
jgi:hypothetical protein